MVSKRLFVGVLGMIDGFVIGGRDVADVAVVASHVGPVHSSRSGGLQVGDRLQWSRSGL